MLGWMEKQLLLPEIKKLNDLSYDAPDYVKANREIILKKEILSYLYEGYYRPFIESAKSAPKEAKMLEVGSGHGLLKEKIPNLITSDFINWPWLDQIIDAANIPYADDELDRIFALFVIHHLPDPKGFLDEAYRTLKPGGEFVILDPAVSWFSKLYYKVHPDEMNVHQKDWEHYEDGDDSNIAMSWIFFMRDHEKFKKLYPRFEIESVSYNTCLTYLLSGGFRIHQMLPTFILKIISKTENWLIQHLFPSLAVSMHIRIRKK